MMRLLPFALFLLFSLRAQATLWWTNTMDTNALLRLKSLGANGDTIVATNTTAWAVYTSMLVWDKDIHVIGPGVNFPGIISKVNIGGGDPFAATATAIKLVGGGSANFPKLANFVLTNALGTYDGCGILVAGPAKFRVNNVVISGFKFPMYTFAYGCVDHFAFTNNFVVHTYGPSGGSIFEWSNLYPIPFTNIWEYTVFEYGNFGFDANWPTLSTPGGGYHGMTASGQSGSGIVRYCNAYGDRGTFGPAIDWHGDNNDGLHGAVSWQVTSNKVYLGGTGNIEKFVDARGGEGIVDGNDIIGATSSGTAVREEYPGAFPSDPDPMDIVTNMYCWDNNNNGSLMAIFKDPDTGGGPGSADPGFNLLALNQNYFTNAPNPASRPYNIVLVHPLDVADPLITGQPSDQTVTAPAAATFSVTASSQSSLPFTYQWARNGTPIAGATLSSLNTGATTTGNNGDLYSVTVTDQMGPAVSRSALLNVNGGLILGGPPYQKTYGRGTHGQGTR